jgi:glycosyltransferase involved in cell wall biosynthesis
MIAVFTAHVGHYHHARYRALTEAGVRFVVISFEQAADFDQLMSTEKADFVVEKVFASAAAYRVAIGNGELRRRTFGLLEKWRPEVVALAGWSRPESMIAADWARHARSRLVMMSESQAGDASRSRFREALKSRIVRSCDAALVGGRTHRDYVQRLGMPPDRIFLGYDAVDNGHFDRGAAAARADARAARQLLGLPDRYLLASARFVQKKNLPRLVEAYASAQRISVDFPHLVILGDGPERPLIEATARRTGVADKVHLPGFKSYGDLPAYYGLTDAFIHVSTSEQWGLVINEAAASGLPLIVSHPCGAAGELVTPGKNGFIVDPRDCTSIAHAIRKIASLPPATRREMGEASRALVRDWDVARFADGMQSACACARQLPSRRLAPWDRVLLRQLSRRTIEDVA